MRAGHPYQYTAGRSELPCAHLSHPLPGYSLCVPLVSQDETLGILHIQASQCGDDEAVRSRRELSINIAEQLALAISNLRLREMLRHESIRDPLTNLFNRRYLEETLDVRYAAWNVNSSLSRSSYSTSIISSVTTTPAAMMLETWCW